MAATDGSKARNGSITMDHGRVVIYRLISKFLKFHIFRSMRALLKSLRTRVSVTEDPNRWTFFGVAWACALGVLFSSGMVLTTVFR